MRVILSGSSERDIYYYRNLLAELWKNPSRDVYEKMEGISGEERSSPKIC